MDQACPKHGRSSQHGGTDRNISAVKRAAPTAIAEGGGNSPARGHPIRS